MVIVPLTKMVISKKMMTPFALGRWENFHFSQKASHNIGINQRCDGFLYVSIDIYMH